MGFIIIEAIGKLNVLWGILDTLNALMAIPDLIGVISPSGIIVKMQKEYFEEIGGKNNNRSRKGELKNWFSFIVNGKKSLKRLFTLQHRLRLLEFVLLPLLH